MGFAFSRPRKPSRFSVGIKRHVSIRSPWRTRDGSALRSEAEALPLPPAGIPIAMVLRVVGSSNSTTPLMPEVYARNILDIQD